MNLEKENTKKCIPLLFLEFSAWEKGSRKAKRYIIKNSNGQLMFYAVQETSNSCSFSSKIDVINIVDNLNKTVMKIEQEIKCCSLFFLPNWFKACSNKIKIEAPVGKPIGFLRQK